MNRRDVLGFLTDDLLAYWLANDETLREWLATPTAVDSATEVIHMVLESLEVHGYRIVSSDD